MPVYHSFIGLFHAALTLLHLPTYPSKPGWHVFSHCPKTLDHFPPLDPSPYRSEQSEILACDGVRPPHLHVCKLHAQAPLCITLLAWVANIVCSGSVLTVSCSPFGTTSISPVCRGAVARAPYLPCLQHYQCSPCQSKEYQLGDSKTDGIKITIS